MSNKTKKGQVGVVVGLTIAIILIAILVVGVGLPLLNGASDTYNFTGTLKTVVDNLAVIAAVAALIILIGYFYFKNK